MGILEVISAIQDRFPSDQIVLRGSDEYKRLNSSYLSTLESDIQPACILLPHSKEEVALFVKTLKPLIAKGEAAFAIRGAGQQPAPGCANIQDGITLDLRPLKGVEVNNSYVAVGAGEQLGAVYEVVQKHGLGVSGSRSARGGVGSLSLTGGLSFFSTREGFICDTVKNYEVVLASGEVVNANISENSDLFRALKGGGNNFGIVTRFDLHTFQQGRFWGGSVYYFPSSFPSQIEALCAEINKPDATVETHIMMSIGYAAQSASIICANQVYYTREAEDPQVLHPFTNITPQIDAMNTLRSLTLVEAANEQLSDTPEPKRCMYMNCVVRADPATLQAASDIYTSKLGPVKPCAGLLAALTLQPYARSLLEQSQRNGGNSLDLDPAQGSLVSILLLTYWEDRNDDELVIGTIKSILQQIEADAEKRGTLCQFKLMNYAHTHQDVVGSYGLKGKKKLQEVSRKYDPDGIFQKGVPGGWKLFP